jgi:2-octaprenyl-6-methoxyphenol hydroxylase
MAFGLLAARAGFIVHILDAQPIQRLKQDRRLLALSYGSVLVLQKILDGPVGPSAPILNIHVSSQGEPGHVRLGQSDFPDHVLGSTVWYADLVDALDRAIAKQPLIHMRRPCHATAIVTNQTRDVSIHLDDGLPLNASLLVVAEGTPGHATARQSGLLADVLMPGFPEGLALERFTRDGPLALLPLPPPKDDPARETPPGKRWMSMIWCQPGVRCEQRLQADPAVLCRDIGAALGARWGTPVRIGPRHAFPLATHRREQVTDGRTVYVGNAAQAMHPVAGQGFNLGLRDVATLVDCLIEARRTAQSQHHSAFDPVNALEAYRQQRRLDRRLLPGLTGLLPPFFSSRLPGASTARTLSLMALDLCPPLRRAFARLLMLGPGQ